MSYKLTDNFKTRNAGIALGVLLSAALSLPVQAAEIWKVNLAKSTFSSGANMLVLERSNGTARDTREDSTAGGFLVIANGKVYLATSETAYDASSANGVRTVDYTRWKDMKLVEVGDKVRSADHCGFRCQAGLPDTRMTLTFRANGADLSKQMSNILVLNK